MTIQPILAWPHARLRAAAAPVDEITKEVRQLWTDLVETMDFMPGIGMAAPQIGVMLQVAVVDVSRERNRRILLANPKIVAASADRVTREEASPCLPGLSAKVMRPRQVTVAYLTPKGEAAERLFEGMEATSVQHQIDHLAGRMYFDNLSKVKRDMLLRRARKIKS